MAWLTFGESRHSAVATRSLIQPDTACDVRARTASRYSCLACDELRWTARGTSASVKHMSAATEAEGARSRFREKQASRMVLLAAALHHDRPCSGCSHTAGFIPGACTTFWNSTAGSRHVGSKESRSRSPRLSAMDASVDVTKDTDEMESQLRAHLPTPMTPMVFRNRRVFVKRDDTLEVCGILGSKVRKFSSLMQYGALRGVTHIVSHGGVQSNAMRSLAALANAREKQFIYYTSRPVTERLRIQKDSNLRAGLDSGMDLRTIQHETYKHIFGTLDEQQREDWLCHELGCAHGRNLLFVPQGGAWANAEVGVAELAKEIVEQLASMRADGKLEYPDKRPIVFLGSGTGTTAYFLARHLGGKARVITVPVAGSVEYLTRQMNALTSVPQGPMLDVQDGLFLPELLYPRLKSAFADVSDSKLRMWHEMQRATGGDFNFDLIYAPRAWEEFWLACDERRLDLDRDIIFLHTGGVEGNVSMLNRYLYKGLVSADFVFNYQS